MLLNSEHEILLNIPSGKRYLSNPHSYFKQPSQKGSTCWYYSLKFIQPRVGKHPELQYLPERLFEKSLSTLRKNLTTIEVEYRASKAWLKTLCENSEELEKGPLVLDKLFVEDSKKVLESLIEDGFLEDSDSQKELQLYEDFLKQNTYKTLDEFIQCQSLLKEIRLMEDFLATFHIDLEQEGNAYLRTENNSKHTYHSLLAHTTKAAFESVKTTLFYTIIKTICSGYDISISDWKPSDDIYKMITTLKAQGALVVMGILGKPYESSPNPNVQSLHHYNIISHKPFVTTAPSSSHCVVVIGASVKDSKEYVYIIDPNDESDPNQPRVVYEMTYQDFCKSLYNLYGNKTDKNGYLLNGRYEFAYYANQKRMCELNDMAESLNQLTENVSTISPDSLLSDVELEICSEILSAFSNDTRALSEHLDLDAEDCAERPSKLRKV